MAFYSPLRYPGGKGNLSAFFYEAIKENDLSDGVYVEPYAGGASIALSLLFNEYVSSVIINDIDRSIYAFWHSVLYNTDKLCELISKTKINMNIWRKCKEIQRRKNRTALLELAFSTFFLNRSNRSGIISGGVIGGQKQLGEWKIDARFNKKDLIERIKRISQYRDRITIYNMDARALINKAFRSLKDKSLCYFDPPYYDKGRKLYVNYYEEADHIKMAKKISSIKRIKWVVSYDNKPEVKEMYNNFRNFEYTLNYSAADTRLGNEVMFFSNNLTVSDRMLSGLTQ